MSTLITPERKMIDIHMHLIPGSATGLNWLYENCEEHYADGIAWKNAELLCR